MDIVSEGPNSLCQTAHVNSLDGMDNFWLWAPTRPGKAEGQIESQMVAWCSTGGHSIRVMPEGTLTGVQLTKTPDFIQIVGFIDQTKINMVHGGIGAKMGPHEANEVLFL